MFPPINPMSERVYNKNRNDELSQYRPAHRKSRRLSLNFFRKLSFSLPKLGTRAERRPMPRTERRATEHA